MDSYLTTIDDCLQDFAENLEFSRFEFCGFPRRDDGAHQTIDAVPHSGGGARHHFCDGLVNNSRILADLNNWR